MLFRMKQRISVCFLLEGGADGIVAGGRIGGAYGDLAGHATGFAVVVGTVLHVAADALNVIATLLVVHFIYHPYDFRGLAALLL